MSALTLKANKSKKLLRHLKVWFYENLLKKSTLVLRRPTTKNSEGNLFQADATFHYTTFNYENFNTTGIMIAI